jgi:beta-lactamase superfamily II metal-dependent hydrolase
MNSISRAALAVFLLGCRTRADAVAADKRLDVYWIDVEGGSSVLLVTPAGESVLIDSGYPGDRDADRVKKACDAAGVKKIDHMLVTHFHADHFGALADILKRIPIGNLWTRDVAHAAETERNDPKLAVLKDAKVDERHLVKVGQTLPLKQAPGASALALRFIGSDKTFIDDKNAKDNAAICAEGQPKPEDTTDNANSVVSLVTLGEFRFFAGGDLTWNLESQLVCPKNRVGEIDVFQIDHHGLDKSNNPVLIKSLAPTVAVVNSGPRKGGEPGTFATLKATPSIQDIYQLHRNVRLPADQNPPPAFIANMEEDGDAGNLVKMSVDPTGKTYVVSIPATKTEKTYATRRH